MSPMAHGKRTSEEMSTLGSRAMRDPVSLTLDEIESLGACVVAQFEPRKSALADLAISGAHGVYNGPGTLSHYLRNRLGG